MCDFKKSYALATPVVIRHRQNSARVKLVACVDKNYSIPLAFHSIFDKLIQFIEKHNCSLEYKTKPIKSSGTKAKIPTEYTLSDMWAVDTYTIKEGLMVKKTTEQHPDANKRKLIISNKASFTGCLLMRENWV